VTIPPNRGRRVLVTRAAHQAAKLSDALRALGAVPVEVPVLEIRKPVSFAALDAALSQIASYDWLILTSANAVWALMDRATELGIASGRFDGIHVAVIGEGTAAAARKTGLKITLVPEAYVAEDLVAALGNRTHGKHVLLARAAVARDVIPDVLRASGALVDVADAYRNAMPEAAPEQLRLAIAKTIDAVAFTSSSSVTHLRQAVEAAGLAWPLAGALAVSIGPVTSQTLRKFGWEPQAEADPHDVAGLAKAVLAALDSGIA
jgi:uroporphyrinogen-III synthase